MSCAGTANCTCGCCSGASVQTPQPRNNSLGLAAVPYRVGTWWSFNESMLARLSSSDYPALANLKTRGSDDFTIALLDASAIVLDVLSFYQERLANEGYLRTAQQPRSLTELSRLIGYQPSPGVSASTYVAFTLKAAPGEAPDPTTASTTIPQGTQVQSVPPQGQKAQTFETAADIQAKADWNALPVQTSAPWVAPGNLSAGATPGPGGVYLSGTTTQLQVGDSLLILGVNRETWPPGTQNPISAVTNANPAQFTVTGHGLSTGNQVSLQGFAAAYATLNGEAYVVKVVDQNNFTLTELSGLSISTIDFGSYGGGGVIAPSGEWGVVVLDKVCIDTANKLTYVAWNAPLPVAQSATLGSSPSVRVLNPSTRSAVRERFRPNDPVSAEQSAVSWQSGLLTELTVIPNLYGEYISLQQPPLMGMQAVPDSAFSSSPWTAAKVFAFRQKASLFGHNAPNPNLFVTSSQTPANGLIGGAYPAFSWNSFWVNSSGAFPPEIDLDAPYAKAVAGSWFALVVKGAAQLYRVATAQAVSRSDFALSGKITRLTPDYALDPLLGSNSAFTLLGTEVWLQSDQLTVAPQPLAYPLYGAVVDLQVLRPDLVGLEVIAIAGKRQKLAVAAGVTGLSFIPDDGTAPVPMNPGDVFTLTDPTALIAGALPFADWSQATTPLILSVEDINGRTGVAQAALSQFILTTSGASDPFVSEYALVSVVQGTPVPYAHTQIQLQAPLANCYERASTSVNANVALVTHGQSVSEIMGSGNASTPNQSFTLKQSPLTYVQAPTPTGRQSTLQVQVNGVAWTEVGSLYGAMQSQQVFDILNQSDGAVDVLFGDGDEGALLPTGQSNLLANYRISLGKSGNVPANTLTTLIDRPLGVSAVTNPEAATGGQDAQSLEDIRTNAPRSVLTLGRAVSLSDYENYAAGFAGITKAHAQWIPSGRSRGVFLTVAAVGGVALSADPTLNNLIASLRNYGNPLIPITVQSFVETLFGFSADLQYDPSYQMPAVKAQVLQTLSTAFGFAQRNFGQGVSVDEISTVMQNVPGVVAVNVYSLNVVRSSTAGDLASFSTGFSLANWKNWIAPYVFVPRPRPVTKISAFFPVANGQFSPLPAEILVLDPDPSSVVLGVMS